ncbi:16S rRNA (guanine(966)-N(2))-methyltransferase RsmD [Acetobacter okinawensis]|uniref:Methyltransferase n=1 Tax=Acetobacter okinawensis TaxID=1076594 RepID=A0A252BSL6_9PROT|nr:16S rRNA (guanine(966)-N(2))-methyltransferase RsmD [Acetobacter okinawensis]OUJ11632.1 methyltransferase [Acetobacter okinawensis]
MVRIIAGARKGRVLAAPGGGTTRPTADRVRQALFDVLAHAPWGGAALLEGAHVLDAFAGTGALGLEAMSRGAAHAIFFETDRNALAALRTNVHACGWAGDCQIYPRDVTNPPAARTAPATLLFLDPPYHKGLPGKALAALSAKGWVAPNAIAVIETGRDEPLPFTDENAEAPPCPHDLLAERQHGAARLSIWRLA